jgi:nitrate reductase beta subunit
MRSFWRKRYDSEPKHYEEIEAIYPMTSLTSFEERFVVPPFLRKRAIETVIPPEDRKGERGTGLIRKPKRRW